MLFVIQERSFYFMARIKYSKFLSDNFVLYDFDLQCEYDLTDAEVKVFGFFRRHCFTFKKNDNYWCGLSNENIAKATCTSLRTLKRCLQTLKEKGLIVIENPGTGFRKIYLNDALYLDQDAPSVQEVALKEQMKEKEREIERLKAELDRVSAIAKRVEELEAAAVPNAYVQRFIEAKYIKKADIPRAVGQLNDLYKGFMLEYGVSELEYHIDYILKELASKQVKNVISYLAKAVGERSKQLASKPKQEKTPKITRNPNKKEDWLDRMQRMNQETDEDPEETARIQKELAEIMSQIGREPESESKDDEQLSLFDI